ncbi:MAG: hypothetical protein AB1757_00950 [Acidobacteriota bacterium]
MINNRLFAITLFIFLTAGLTGAFAQSQNTQEQKPRAPRQQTKPVADEKPEVTVEETSEQLLRRTLDSLSEQIGKLASEVQRMRQETERNSTMLELLLNEERLAKIEDKMDEAITTKAQLDNQEADLQRRLRNVPQEVALRGGFGALRKDEAEAALRQEYQRAIESARSQQSTYQTRIGDLQAQADRLKARIEALRKKAERLETRVDGQEK